MQKGLAGLKRTHYCGEVSKNDVGGTVTLMGWAARNRDLGGVIFIDLRDRAGIVQIVFNEQSGADVFQLAESVRGEYVIGAEGVVRERAPETVNANIKTGEIEVVVSRLVIYSKAETPPFYIEEGIDTNEQVRLKYRYLDLRRPDMQRNMILRHKACKIARDYFDSHGFLEIETPMLTKSTPEGARDYLVPSRVHHGAFYALPQSPQQYKQLLMLSGMDRYFQIARCFRDEDLRADRQPEFTQIDLEMSFVETDDVIAVNEGMLAEMFEKTLGLKIPLPFPRLSYQEAMERFGSDKPDTRFGLELIQMTDVVAGCGFKVFADVAASGGSVRAINVKGAADKLSRRDLDALVDFVKIYRAKGLAWFVVTEGEIKSPVTKFLTEDETNAILKRANAEIGDVVLFVADKDAIVFDALGALRSELARRLDLIDSSKFNFLWVTEFPLLEYDDAEKRYTAKHHPFTAPMDEDLGYLDTDPLKARAKAYDVILNGCELGGGSIRIYDGDLQTKLFTLLGFTQEAARERFGHLLDAFKYGTPPHGGMAYGLDRLIMLLTGSDSIRDVMAFPKVQTASEVMTNAPDAVDPKQLMELGIKIADVSL
ncbi:MAG: aspartate--tRNA ligase [Clostridiales bacterium]|jgi:aspartyl-tRNA synthetase|nr:aspartate--tRNA ligase [Clostridiales bacterium]